MPEDGRQRSAEGLWILHHFSQFPADAGANILQLFLFKPIKITIDGCTTKPVNRLLQFAIRIRKLGQKVCGISALGPRFRDICSDGTRRTTNLIYECKFLITGPSFGFIKNRFIQCASQLINLQLFESADSFAHSHLSSVVSGQSSALRPPPSDSQFQRFSGP